MITIAKVTKGVLLFFVIFLLSGALKSQDPNILKGISELREIVFENYSINLKQIELIRQKLDSIDVDKKEFLYFTSQLNYVSKNLYSDELEGREFLISFLLESKAYKKLTEVQKAIVLDNTDLIYFILPGIWGERYPHKIDPHSIRLKEISNYGIKEGEEILHYKAFNNHLCDVLFLSFDSINISHYPVEFKWMDKKLFEMVGSCCTNETRKLNYPLVESSKLDPRKYDKIIYDALGLLDLRRQTNLKYRFKEIYNLLDDEGELIISGNSFNSPFDGPFGSEKYIDSLIKKVMKFRFKLKERIFVEDEFVVYKFSKVLD